MSSKAQSYLEKEMMLRRNEKLTSKEGSFLTHTPGLNSRKNLTDINPNTSVALAERSRSLLADSIKIDIKRCN